MAASDLSPAVLDSIQHHFVEKLGGSLQTVGHYAMDIFYLVAVIELVLFGLAWGFRKDEAFGDFIFKVFKLGVIFFVISAYPGLVQALVNGFTQVALQAVGQGGHVMLKPAKVWQFGFDNAVALLKLATQYGTGNVAVSLLYLTLGFGTLLLFGLLGAQIILVTVLFYLVALVALLLLPLGAFSPMGNMFERAIQALFKAGVRVFVVIMVIGVGATVWGSLNLNPATETTTLMQPLGLFFSALVFVILAYKLPSLAVSAVGEIKGSWFTKGGGQSDVSVNVSTPPPVATAATQASPVAAGSSLASSGVAAASSMSTTVNTAPSGTSSSVASGTSQSAQVNVSTTSNAAQGGKQGKVNKAANVEGVSRETLNQLKATFKQAMQENRGDK